MTTACHNIKIFEKNIKIMEIVDYICYNVNMKKIINFLFILILLLISIFTTKNIIVFANETELNQLDYSVENLDNYNSIDYYSNNIVLTTSQHIVIINQNTSLFQNNDTEMGIYNAKHSIMTTNYLFVFDELNRFQVYNKDFEFIKTCKYVESDNIYNLGVVECIAKDYSGNLYFIDKTNEKILFLNSQNLVITEIDILFEDFGENMCIAVNANGDLLSIYSNQNVYVYDAKNQSLIKKFECLASKIMFDYTNNLFVQYEENITKYNKTNYNFEETKTITIVPKDIILDIETGSFYILSDKLCNYYAVDFASNPSDENERINLSIASKQASQIKFAKANIETKLYSTSVSYSSSFVITKNQLVMLLDEDIEENSSMYYCLTNINGIQKQGYIQKNDFQILEAENHNLSYKTICKNVEVKTYPTHSASNHSIISNEDTSLIVLGTCHDFVDEQSKTYFAIMFEDGVGYVEQKYLVNSNLYESYLTDIIKIPDNSTQFMAYIITVISLFVITLFVSLLIIKKVNKNSTKR